MEVPGSHHIVLQGFSKFGREEKIRLAVKSSANPDKIFGILDSHLHADPGQQMLYDAFSENGISNYFLPFGIAPNFLINGKTYMVPMVTEESSVVAAASSAARFWFERGGFSARVISMRKQGHIHFIWKGEKIDLGDFIDEIVPGFYDATNVLLSSMKKRGGGILDIRLNDLTSRMDGYFQLEVSFNTADSMGANIINSCLESMAQFLRQQAESRSLSGQLEVIMSILSNHAPECLVECEVKTPVEELDNLSGRLSGLAFAEKFITAVTISGIDINRAVTHNKGIFNGMDAVIVATGNDFRATEACGHAYASIDGSYKGLSAATLTGNEFIFKLKVPMMVGTVGGLTRLHPMASTALDILGNPGAAELMTIVAATGLASNFSAIRALITTGIQKGHMRLHLINLLNQLGANQEEMSKALEHFRNTIVSSVAVAEFLKKTRAGAI